MSIASQNSYTFNVDPSSDYFEITVTLSRLLCMNRFYTIEEYQGLTDAFAQVAGSEVFGSVVRLLSGIGMDDCGILPYYGPQIIENTKRWAVKNGVDMSEVHQITLSIFANISTQLNWEIIPIGRTIIDLTAVAKMCIDDPRRATTQTWNVSEIIESSIGISL